MEFKNKIHIFTKFIESYWKSILITFIILILIPLIIWGNKPIQCAYVVAIVALFWITEVFHLAVTSLIPIVMFPAFGILTPSAIANCYMKDITIMLIGGLIVAKTIEKQNLHRRLALNILKIMGPNPIFQYMGFMLTTWMLSMWISNTATTAMMITLAAAVVESRRATELNTKNEIENVNRENTLETVTVEMNDLKTVDSNFREKPIKYNKENIRKFEKGLFLCIAYSATCGGIATLPGTGTNLAFYGFMEERYGSKLKLNFVSFMIFALPLSIINVIFTWIVLCLKYIGIRSIFKRKRNSKKDSKMTKLLDEEITSLGSISYGEVSTLVVFGLLVLLWVLREPGIPLWGKLFTYKNAKGQDVKYWSDAISAVVASLLVFILPAKNPFKHNSNEKLMEWTYLEKEFSWGLVFLFGGGFALAAGCESSGLSVVIGSYLINLRYLPHYAIILIISLCISFLTEINSNTATLTLLLPIMLKMSECIKMHPMTLGLSVAMACSFSFCLPTATPPNAIVFSTGRVRVIDMVTSGLALNMFCVFVLSLMTYYYTVPIFQTNVLPDWINTNCSNF